MPGVNHASFYQFVPVAKPQVVADAVHELCTRLELLGHVLVAAEGINGMVAGTADAVTEFVAQLQSDAVNDGGFADLVAKRTDCDRPPFKKLKVKVKEEIVPLGVTGFDPTKRLADIAAADVPPQEWREFIARDDVVLIDNRNSFEYQVGRFRGAVDPEVTDFRDFADYVRGHADEWKASGTTVAMYCTGGIRCEKSSAWMQDLGLEVRQLQGGIINYFQQVPDADADWDGECFVFDDRVTLNTRCEDMGRTFKDIPGQFPAGTPFPAHHADIPAQDR